MPGRSRRYGRGKTCGKAESWEGAFPALCKVFLLSHLKLAITISRFSKNRGEVKSPLFIEIELLDT